MVTALWVLLDLWMVWRTDLMTKPLSQTDKVVTDDAFGWVPSRIHADVKAGGLSKLLLAKGSRKHPDKISPKGYIC